MTVGIVGHDGVRSGLVLGCEFKLDVLVVLGTVSVDEDPAASAHF